MGWENSKCKDAVIGTSYHTIGIIRQFGESMPGKECSNWYLTDSQYPVCVRYYISLYLSLSSCENSWEDIQHAYAYILKYQYNCSIENSGDMMVAWICVEAMDIV